MSCSWQRTQGDLQQLRSDLDAVSMKCNSFLHQSPSGSCVSTLHSELNLLMEKMDHVYGLSTVYLNKWVSWGFGSKWQCFPLGWEGADLDEHVPMIRDHSLCSSKYGVGSFGSTEQKYQWERLIYSVRTPLYLISVWLDTSEKRRRKKKKGH